MGSLEGGKKLQPSVEIKKEVIEKSRENIMNNFENIAMFLLHIYF